MDHIYIGIIWKQVRRTLLRINKLINVYWGEVIQKSARDKGLGLAEPFLVTS